MRRLTEPALNRAVLARQHLLARTDRSIPQVLEDVAGLQTQYAPTAYVGLLARREGFGRDDLTRALTSRAVVQATMMRSTIHMASAADYPAFVAAVRAARRRDWLRFGRQEPARMEELARRTQDLLRDGPRRRRDLVAELGVDSETWIGIGLWLDLVRVPPSGTWERRRADLYGLAEGWVPLPEQDPDAAAVHLVRRYLGGFGPATLAGVAAWTGLPAGRLRAVLDRLPLRRFLGPSGEELVDLEGAPLPGPEAPAPVRFLGPWEACLLVHVRPAGILPEGYREHVFNVRMPQSTGTLLIDGRVAGRWRWDGGRVATDPFEPLDARWRRELAAEVDHLEALAC